MNLDLNSLIQETLGVASELGNTATQLPRIANEMSDIAEQQAKGARDAADASAQIATIELSDKQRQEQQRQALALRLGTDPTAANSVVLQAADQLRVADAQLADAAARIHEKKSINPLENLPGWLMAKLTINSDIADYNFAAENKDRAEETAQAFAALQEQGFKSINALTHTVSDAYINASKVVQAQQYNDRAFQAALVAKRANYEGIQAASNAGRDRLQTLFSGLNAVNQERSYQLSLAHLEQSRAEFNLRKKAFEEKDQEDNLVFKYIQQGYFNTTGKVLEAARGKDLVMLYKAKQPEIVDMFESGLQSFMVSPGGDPMPVISLNPGTAARMFEQGKVRNLPPAQQQVGEQLVSWRREFDTQAVQNAAKYQFDPKDKASVDKAFARFVQEKRAMEIGNVREGSVFAPAPVAQVAANNKFVAGLPVWKNVLEPASKTGVNVNDPNIAFGLVQAAMKEGKLSYVDAVDLSMIYAAGLDLNNQARKFISVGLPPVLSYNANVNIPLTLGSTTFNFADQKEVARALNKASAADVLKRNIGMVNNPISGAAEFGAASINVGAGIGEAARNRITQ